jgi:hypothetical protein
MKKCTFCGIFIILFIILFFCENSFAISLRKDYFYKPQIGGWFGPISPVAETGKDLKTNLGGGIFARYNIPWPYFKIGLDLSYQNYDSKGINELTLVPVYATGLFLLPIPIPVRFQLKLGLGPTYIKMLPDESSQWDLLFVTGLEISFPAGRIVNIGLRLDYQLVVESYMKKADRDGHFIIVGVQLFFNI